jgi:hypothetical protein
MSQCLTLYNNMLIKIHHKKDALALNQHHPDNVVDTCVFSFPHK